MADPKDLTPEELKYLSDRGIDPSRVTISTNEEQPTSKQSITQGIVNKLLARAGGTVVGGLGSLGGGAAGFAAGEALFPPGGGIPGAIIGSLAGGAGGGYVGQKAQEAIIPEDVQKGLETKEAEFQQEHPNIGLGTDIVSSALASGGKFSPSTILKALKGGKPELAQVALNALVNPAINTGVGYATTGQLPSAKELAFESIGGGLFSAPNALARKFGAIKPAKSEAEPTPEPTDTKTETESKPLEGSPWADPEVSDDTIRAAYKDYIKSTKPTKPEDAYNNPDYYKSLVDWKKSSQATIEQQRQTLHDLWMKQQANPIVEPTKESVPEVKIPTTQTTPTATSEDLGAQRDKQQEDLINEGNEGNLPFKDQEGPNKPVETPEGQIEQTEQKKEEVPNAIQIQSPSSILPHPQETVGEAGSQREGVGQSDQGKEVASKSNTGDRETLNADYPVNNKQQVDLFKQHLTKVSSESLEQAYKDAQNRAQVLKANGDNFGAYNEAVKGQFYREELQNRKVNDFLKAREEQVSQQYENKDVPKPLPQPLNENALRILNKNTLLKSNIDRPLSDTLIQHLENLKVKPTSGQLSMGVVPAVWNTALTAAQQILKAGGTVQQAIAKALAHIQANHRGAPINVKEIEQHLQKALQPEQVSSKDFGSVGKYFSSVLDKIRSIPHEGAKVLANSFQKALNDRQGYIGRWFNPSVEKGNELSKQELDNLNKAIEQRRNGLKVTTPLTKRAQDWFNQNAKIIDDIGKEHTALNIPITQGNQKRQMIQNPNYWPTTGNQKVEEAFRANTDQNLLNQYRKDWIDYGTKVLGQSPRDAQDHLNAWEKSIKGSADNSVQSHLDYYNAIRKAQGNPLPPSFREQNPVRNMARYIDRVSTSMAHYKDVESNPKAMATLGATKDAWGNKISPIKGGSLASNDEVKAALGQFHHIPTGVAEHAEEAASSIATRMFISSPGLEVHKLGSNLIKTVLTPLQFTSNPYYAAKALAAGLSNIREGWTNAKKGGLVKLPVSKVSDMLDGSLTSYQRMAGISKLVSQVSTLGDLTTRLNAGFTQSYFDSLIPSVISRANSGDINAARMLKHWDPSYTSGKTYSPTETRNLASIAASYIHGTGDIRQMPKWMMNEGEISGFLQLAHWSVAQTNSFLHDVLIPAKKGNLTPLVTGLFGSAVAGYLIKDIREQIQGKQGQIPSLSEINASEGGLQGHTGLLAYNAIAGMQYAGFAGLLSQIAKYPFDAVYKNEPQGATFPLDEIGSDIVSSLHEIATAAANDPNFNWGDAAAQFAKNVFSHNIKLANIALNQGINTGLVEGTVAEKKQLADKLGELRRFEQIQGLPVSDIDTASNPYMNLEAKKFRMEQDPQKAAQMVPGLVSNLITTYGDRPDVLMSKLKGLKQNSYSTFPSLETMPLEFVKYVQYLGREKGEQQAKLAVADYMKHNAINEVKSSLIP